MITLTILSLALTIPFIGIAIARERSLPDSISALVYVFKHKWLWTIWLWLVALLTLIPCIEILLRISMEFLGFGTMACLVFCGAMPLFDKDNVRWHWITGIAGCILSQLCVYFICCDWLSLWGVFAFLAGSKYIQPEGWLGKAVKGKEVFLAECTCYVALMGAELMYYLS